MSSNKPSSPDRARVWFLRFLTVLPILVYFGFILYSLPNVHSIGDFLALVIIGFFVIGIFAVAFWAALDAIEILDWEFVDQWIERPIDRILHIADPNWIWDDDAWRSIPTTKVEEYSEYLKSDEWQQKRTYMFSKAGNVCQQCSSSLRLELHHVTYKRIGKERTTDLRVLCRECHKAEHGIEEAA